MSGRKPSPKALGVWAAFPAVVFLSLDSAGEAAGLWGGLPCVLHFSLGLGSSGMPGLLSHTTMILTLSCSLSPASNPYTRTFVPQNGVSLAERLFCPSLIAQGDATGPSSPVLSCLHGAQLALSDSENESPSSLGKQPCRPGAQSHCAGALPKGGTLCRVHSHPLRWAGPAGQEPLLPEFSTSG